MGAYDYLDPMTFNEMEYLLSGGLLGRRDPELGRSLMEDMLNPAIPEQLKSKIRRTFCKNDPLMFALIYLNRHVTDKEGNTTFSRFHFDMLGDAAEVIPNADKLPIAAKRKAFVAPRGAGKSTIMFLILPMWAMTHRHRKFITAYGASAEPIEDHLKTFRDEMATNELLRLDHPRMTQAKVDRSSLYHAKNETAFSVKGLDRATRGQKNEENRPDWILFDDVELGESNYSDKEVEKRKTTILNDIIGGDPTAVVNFVGTVTRAGSLMHDILRQIQEKEPVAWVKEQEISCNYYPALITSPDGSKKSMWLNNPREEWSTEWMLANERTNQFQVEKMNNPMGKTGKYWSKDDILYTRDDPGYLALGTIPIGSRTILMIDPSVTTKDSSDWTGLTIARYVPAMKLDDGTVTIPVVELLESYPVKMVNEELRSEVIKLIIRYPEIRYVRVEVNQGHDLWGIAHSANSPRSKAGVFHDLPEGVGLMIEKTTMNKEVKFAQAHDYYVRPIVKILHRKEFGELERQLIEFPRARFDDVADSAVMAILYFLKPKPKKMSTAVLTESYI